MLNRILIKALNEVTNKEVDEALDQWVGNPDTWEYNTEPLVKLYQTKPDLFKEMRKTSQVLYRGISLTKTELKSLNEGKLLSPQTILESWTTDREEAREYAILAEAFDTRTGEKRNIFAVCKKKIPVRDQLIDLGRYYEDFGSGEVIVKAKPLRKTDIVEIF